MAWQLVDQMIDVALQPFEKVTELSVTHTVDNGMVLFWHSTLAEHYLYPVVFGKHIPSFLKYLGLSV